MNSLKFPLLYLRAPSYGSGKTIISFVLTAFLLQACSAFEQKEDVDLKQKAVEYNRISINDRNEETWWSSFNSSELVSLLDMAEQGNPDVTRSVARILRAEKELQRARTDYFPNISSDFGGTQRNIPYADPGMDSGGTSWQTSFRASYEVDLWGKVSAGVDSAKARQEATQFDHDASTISLFSDIANGYFNLLSLKEQMEATRKHFDLAREVAELSAFKVQHGVASELENSRQQSIIAGLEARLSDIEKQIGAQRDALGQLTGGTGEDLPDLDDTFLDLSIPDPVFTSIDDIIESRPDIQAMEARLRAAEGDVAMARAELLPSLSLSAGGSVSAQTMRLLMDPLNLVLNVTGSITSNVFDAGRNRITVEISELDQMALLEEYRSLLLASIRETATALRDINAHKEIEGHRLTALKASSRALDVAQSQYQAGSIDYLEFLDAQRAFIDSELQYIAARQDRMSAAVSLYRSSGGAGTIGVLNKDVPK